MGNENIQIDAHFVGKSTMSDENQMSALAFKTWFGNSMVVDSKGKPMVVYHASESARTEFKPLSYGTSGEHSYFYFAKSDSWAKKFYKDERHTDPVIHKIYLAIENPLDLRGAVKTGLEWQEYFKSIGVHINSFKKEKLDGLGRRDIAAWQVLRFDTPLMGGIREQLIELGYDGLILSDVARGKADNTTYVAFSPNQIKSAVRNNGNFDANKPHIRFSLGDQTEPSHSPDFKDWFGDSKVVDADGKPLTVYHGTHADKFSIFHCPDSVWVGPGMNDVKDIHRIYFTDSKKTARTYGKRVEEVYLSMKNPLDLNAAGEPWGKFHPAGYLPQAVSNGHDGMIVRNLRDDATGKGTPATTYIAFDPNQIKSATGNFHQDLMKDENPLLVQTATKGFKNWFGNSQVVDADGKPMVVYHGTVSDFDSFDPKSHRSILNEKYQGDGFHFSESADVASQYADASRNQFFNKQRIFDAVDRVLSKQLASIFKEVVNDGYNKAWDKPVEEIREIIAAENASGIDINDLLDLTEYVEGSNCHKGNDNSWGGGGALDLFGGTRAYMPDWVRDSAVKFGLDSALPNQNVMPVYLKAEKVLRTSDPNEARQAKGNGYDAVYYSGTGTIDGQPEWIVFHPEQIKSAISNNGQFDADDPNIMFSRKTADSIQSTPSSPEMGMQYDDVLHSRAMPDTTLAFKQWFDRSKVVSEDGEPLVVYHGTPVGERGGMAIGDIATFDRLFTQKFFGRAPGIDQVGSWFSDNPSDDGGAGMYTPNINGAMYPVYLAIKNPWEVSFSGLKRQMNKHSGAPMDEWNDARPTEKGVEGLRSWMKEVGFDGIKILHDEYSDNGSTEFKNQNAWIALDPNQIKSSIGNNGDFDSENSSILHSHATLDRRRNAADLNQSRTAVVEAKARFDQFRKLKEARSAAVKAQNVFDEVDAQALAGKEVDGDNYFSLSSALFDAKKQFAEELTAIPDDAFALQATTSDGRMLLLNGSAQRDGHWQLTRFDRSGEPWGDTQHPTKTQAIKDFLDEADVATVKDFDQVLRKTNSGNSSGTSATNIQSAIAPIIAAWNNAPKGGVHVVQSIDDLPAAVKAQLSTAARYDTSGLFIPQTQAVYLIADHITDEAHAQFVLGHEVLGHYGMRAFLPEVELSNQLRMLRKANPRLAALAQKQTTQFGYGLNLATEEALADMAGMNEQISGLGQIVAKLQQGLRKIKFDRLADWMESHTEAETMYFLRRARDAVRGIKVHAFGVKESMAMFSRQDGPAPAFYSALRRTIPQLARIASKDGTIKADQALAWLAARQKEGKFKQEELEWSGLKDWLATATEKVAVADIDAFLQDNGVQVQEVVKGDPDEYAQRAKQSDLVDSISRRLFGEIRHTGSQLEIKGVKYFDDELAYALIDGDVLPGDLPMELQEPAAQWVVEYPKLQNFKPKHYTNTKYSQYVLPGGENYRELLLTLPEKIEPGNVIPKEEWLKQQPWYISGQRPTEHNISTLYQQWVQRENNGKSNAFRSNHWDESNIVAHIRFNDRIDAEGNRVLFIEELQSDWGQVGKKRGFNSNDSSNGASKLEILNRIYTIETIERPKAVNGASEVARQAEAQGIAISENAEWKNKLNEQLNRKEALDSETAELRVNLLEINKQNRMVPDAPFVTKTEAWLSLGIKRMIRYAAENGYDKVAFVNGAQSAERYDLSKQISKVGVTPLDEGKYRVEARGLNGGTVADDIFPEEKLPEVIGKELAERAIKDIGLKPFGLANRSVSYSGLDLKIGGEGMKSFYDKIVPQVVNDVLKKLGGGKVGEVKIDRTDYGKTGRTPENSKYAVFGSQLSFDITPSMRSVAIKEGLPLFSRIAPAVQAFKRWFGDSQVINEEDGTPQVVYHGTDATDIKLFDGRESVGWFSDAPTFASTYADERRSGGDEKNSDESAPNVLPVYLAIRNPLRLPFDMNDDANKADSAIRAVGMSSDQFAWADKAWEIINNSNFMVAAEKAGYDGIRITERGMWTWAPLRSTQIKSATGNTGLFSADNPNIMFSRKAGDSKPFLDHDDVLHSRTMPDTLEFKQWFGDSKTIDADSNPLLLYHGTDAVFSDFDRIYSGANTGTHGFLGQGFYFTDKKSVANNYGSNIVSAYLKMENPATITGNLEYDIKALGLSNLIPKDSDNTFGEILTATEAVRAGIGEIYNSQGIRDWFTNVSAEFNGKDYILRSLTAAEIADSQYVRERLVNHILYQEYAIPNINNMGSIGNAVSPGILTEALKVNGFDGIIADGSDIMGIGSKEYVAFNPTQIKTVANSRNGNFNVCTPNILYSRAMPDTPVFTAAEVVRECVLNSRKDASMLTEAEKIALREKRDCLLDIIKCRQQQGQQDDPGHQQKLDEWNARLGPDSVRPVEQVPPKTIDTANFSKQQKVAFDLQEQHRKERVEFSHNKFALGSFKRKVRQAAANTSLEDDGAVLLLDNLATKLDMGNPVTGKGYLNYLPASKPASDDCGDDDQEQEYPAMR